MGLSFDKQMALTILLLVAALGIDRLLPTGVAGLLTDSDADRNELPFECEGAQGPIHGVIVVDGEAIEEVRILSSKEGLDRRALRDSAFLESFRGKPIAEPIAVDTISGATISSQAVIDIVNDRLARERKQP